jgi:hypothetical protein
MVSLASGLAPRGRACFLCRIALFEIHLHTSVHSSAFT